MSLEIYGLLASSMWRKYVSYVFEGNGLTKREAAGWRSKDKLPTHFFRFTRYSRGTFFKDVALLDKI
jgi:hypothetical protein